MQEACRSHTKFRKRKWSKNR